MIEHIRHEILELTHAIREACSNQNTDAVLRRIDEMERKIMKTQQELAADVRAVTDKLNSVNNTLTKVGAETSGTLAEVQKLNAMIKDLQSKITQGETVTEELETAVRGASTQTDVALQKAHAADDLVPDDTVTST